MTNESKPNPQAAPSHETAPERKPISPRLALAGVAVVVLVTAALAVFGVLSRRSAATVLAERTRSLAAPSVIAAPSTPGAPADSFVLPGNVTAWTDSPIYAR
ncbi:MAG: efflux transporter periplasmic adaptor subunit, partial [Terracidiphilus sp.]